MDRGKTHIHIPYSQRMKRSCEEILSLFLQSYFKNIHDPVLIAVGGSGGSGKSTFCTNIAARLHGTRILNLDNYRTSRYERQSRNLIGSNPEANRISTIQNHLQIMRTGKPFDTPVYNDTKGVADSFFVYYPDKFNILDGEISTYAQFRHLIDFSIFIESGLLTQLSSRLSRDVHVRGYTLRKAVRVFIQSNLIAYRRYGMPSRMWSDICLTCKRDHTIIIKSVSKEISNKVWPFL